MYQSYRRIFYYFTGGWILAVVLWFGLRTPGLISIEDPNYDWTKSLIIAPLFVVMAGAIYGGIAYWIETRLYGRVSLRGLILSVFSFQSIATIGLVLFIYWTYRLLMEDSNISPRDALTGPAMITFVLYSFAVNLSIIFFRQISLMIGARRLKKILFGQFYSPKEEYVAFLFMDLKSSVKTAQELGTKKYSLFIQDCFKDLIAVEPHDAKIYQYIGDEVVLCWYLNPEDNLDVCIAAWESFTYQIKRRRSHYLQEYGLLPVFRGGLHVGPVITAEIGVYKRDIAHHGHTINLAARVQEKGKHLQGDLTLTETAYTQLSMSLQERFTNHGPSVLRNIEEPIILYGL